MQTKVKNQLTDAEVREVAAEVVPLVLSRTRSYRAFNGVLRVARASVSGGSLVPSGDGLLLSQSSSVVPKSRSAA